MSYTARIVWQRDPKDLGRAIAETGQRVKTHMLVPYLEKQAPVIKAQMQREAPWADQTGEARRKLSAEVEQTGDRVALYLSHGVSYGKWLELAHGGRWAIVGPTVMRSGPAIMHGMAGLMERTPGLAPASGWKAW